MELVFPSEKYLNSYINAVNLDGITRPENRWWFTEPDKIIQKAYNQKNGINLKENYVKQTILWLIDNSEFIGEVRIRHELTKELLMHGGNIGYIVVGEKCNKAYATKMLSLALRYCKEKICLKKVLLTCNDENIASIKVIEKNGGKLQDKITNIYNNEKITRRYWIEI